VRGGQYPLARPLRIYTRAAPIGPTRALVDLALSAAGQQAIEREGFIAR
jgi:ABC-type phosphate transport system substrate-binding protein